MMRAARGGCGWRPPRIKESAVGGVREGTDATGLRKPGVRRPVGDGQEAGGGQAPSYVIYVCMVARRLSRGAGDAQGEALGSDAEG